MANTNKYDIIIWDIRALFLYFFFDGHFEWQFQLDAQIEAYLL